VENQDGDRLGKVKDFVVEMRSGQVRYVVISSGGVAGVGSIWKPAPPQAFSLATAKKNTAALECTTVRWTMAPRIGRREVGSLNSPGRLQQIYGYYGQQPPITGKAQSGILQLSTDLIGATVITRQQNKVGRISDLLIDLSG